MMILIPHDKLDRLKLILKPLLFRRKITLKELESGAGWMSFCTKAIPSSSSSSLVTENHQRTGPGCSTCC